MSEKEEMELPREFYPFISGIRDAIMEYNISETRIDEMLDLIEEAITDCLSDAQDDGDKPKEKG